MRLISTERQAKSLIHISFNKMQSRPNTRTLDDETSHTSESKALGTSVKNDPLLPLTPKIVFHFSNIDRSEYPQLNSFWKPPSCFDNLVLKQLSISPNNSHLFGFQNKDKILMGHFSLTFSLRPVSTGIPRKYQHWFFFMKCWMKCIFYVTHNDERCKWGQRKGNLNSFKSFDRCGVFFEY